MQPTEEMTGPRRLRQSLVVAASVAAHVAVLAALGLNHPDLTQAVPPPVFEVTVVPRYILPREAPPRPAQTPPTRSVVPRRPISPDETLPVAPLITPGLPAPSADDPSVVAPGRLSRVLRGSPVGCANQWLLSPEEREACDRRFGKGAKDATFIEPPMSPEKRRAFDAAAASKRAYRAYKEGHVPPGVTTKDGGPQMKELPPIWPPPR